MTLLDFIRARGLTGAKEGCAEGECGACAVALVEATGAGSCYRVVNSCLMFLPMAAGREIYTVEALAVDGELSEAQRAMASGGGSQCGYCTPGFVVSLFAEQYRPERDGTVRHDGAGRQSLPLHRLSTDPRCGTLARACAGRRVSSASRCSRRPLSSRSRHQDFRDRRRSTRVCLCCATHPRAKLVAGATDLGSRVESVRAPMAASDQPRRDRRASGVFQHLRARHDWRRASAATRLAGAGPTRPTRFGSGSRCSPRR